MNIMFVVAAYSRLLFIANRHRKALKRLVRPSSASLAVNQSKKKWKPVKIVFTICAVYICCWGPPGRLTFNFMLVYLRETNR